MPNYYVPTRGLRGFRAFPQYATKSDLPPTQARRTDVLYLVQDEEAAYYWDGSALKLLASGTDANDTVVVDTFADLPTTGDPDKIYLVRDTDTAYLWNDSTSSYDALGTRLKYFDEGRTEYSASSALSELEAANTGGESYDNLAIHLKPKGQGGLFVAESMPHLNNSKAPYCFIINPADSDQTAVNAQLRAIILNEERSTTGNSAAGERGIAINCVDTDMSSGDRCTALNCIFPFADTDTNKFFTAGAYGPGTRNGAWRSWAAGYNPTNRNSSQITIGAGNLDGSTTVNGTAQWHLWEGKVQTTDDTPTALTIDQETGENSPTNFKTATDGYYQFDCDFVVKNVTDSELSAFNVRFGIANDGGTAQLVGQLLFNGVELGAGVDANSVNVSISNSDEVSVNVTGVAGKTINWMTSYRITEVNG